MARHLIGLTGYAGSGKDAVGALLSMRGYTRVAFADAVRTEISDWFSTWAQKYPAVYPPATLSQEVQDNLLSGDLYPEMIWEKPTLPLMRRLLQEWGTEYRRAQDPSYWVKIVEQACSQVGGEVVITDVRFQNEVDWIRSLDGEVWHVKRGKRESSHSSEDVDTLLGIEAVLLNNKTLDDLARQIRRILDS